MTWKSRLSEFGTAHGVKAIGVGVNDWQVCLEALKQRDSDCFLLARRYRLREHDALDEFLPLCQKRGAALQFVVAQPAMS